jgi:hypothetical protein
MKGSITMNRKTVFLLAMLLVAALLLSSSCSFGPGTGLGGGVPGSGNIKVENRPTGTIEAITIDYPGALVLIQPGETDEIEIEADDNLLPQISSEVTAGRLLIKSLAADWKASVNPSTQVKITITVPALNELVISAAVGDVEVNSLHGGDFKLVVSGGAQVKMKDVQVKMLDGTLSGAGNIILAGSAEELKVLLSGVGDFNAGSLKCRRATVELSGMGNATVRVADEMNAIITGAGSINYYGQPHIVQELKGAGSVKAAE